MNDKCHECDMPNPPDYHPHLHCVLWKAYHFDPEFILSQHGYQRTPVDADAK